MSKRKAGGNSLAGLIGAYGSDEEDEGVASGSEASEGEGGGIILINNKGASASSEAEGSDAEGSQASDAAAQQQRDSTGVADDSEAREIDGNEGLVELPPELVEPPDTECDPELQAKVKQYLDIQRSKGIFLKMELKKDRRFRNPDFLQKMVDFFEINDLGTCYPSDIWDPTCLPKEDYYDNLQKQWQAEMDKRHVEKQKSQRIEFTKSASQPDMSKNPLLPQLNNALQQAQAKAAALAQAGKRSKWDHQSGR